jgi:hypothetical protein
MPVLLASRNISRGGLCRLNFAAQFEDPVRLGQKAATTRLLDGPDNLTGVSHPGALCVAEVGTRGFGILGIRRVLDMYYSDVDDALAKIENMKVSTLQPPTRTCSWFPP